MKRLAQSGMARNAVWMFAGQGLTFVMQAASFVLLARMLGHVQYGIFAGAFAFVSNLSAYSTLGSGMLLLRNVSRDRERFAEYWGNVLLSTLAAGTVLAVLLSRLGHRLLDQRSAAVVFWIALSECLCGRLVECAGQAFQAHEQLRFTATLNSLVNGLRLALIVILWVTLGHIRVETWAIGSLSVSLIALLLALGMVTRCFGWPRFQVGLLRRELMEGLGFSISGSTISVYNDVDKTILSHYRMSAANGIYTMAYRVVDIGTIPVYAMYSAVLPRAFHVGRDGIEAVFPLGFKMLRKALMFGAAAAVGMLLCAPLTPHVLGASFGESVGAIRWLCLIPLFRSFHLSAGAILTGSGNHKFRTGAQAVAAISNVALNLYLIPKYSWLGAAWASLLTDGGLAVMNWLLAAWLKQRAKNRSLPIVEFDVTDRIAA